MTTNPSSPPKKTPTLSGSEARPQPLTSPQAKTAETVEITKALIAEVQFPPAITETNTSLSDLAEANASANEEARRIIAQATATKPAMTMTSQVNGTKVSESTPSPAFGEIPLQVTLSQEQADVHFTHLFGRISDAAHANAVGQGLWEPGRDNLSAKLMKVVSELSTLESELTQVERSNDKQLINFHADEIACANAILLLTDIAGHIATVSEFRLAEAVLAKHRFNLGRD